jgi:hypothetical protein
MFLQEELSYNFSLSALFSFPNHYPSDRRELRWNLMLRIGSEPLAGMALRLSFILI